MQPAGVGANSTVFVLSMALALIPAETACGSTDVEHSADQLLVGPSSASRETACDGANVGAVKIETNALD